MIDAGILNDKPKAAKVFDPDAGVEVKATAKGFSTCLREPGDVFRVPVGRKASWFVPVEKPAAAKAKGNVLSDADLA